MRLPRLRRLGAQATVSLLNDYFTIMVECIQDEGGMLDKFIGDAIMAIWGAPVDHENDTQNAVMAALKMREALVNLNKKRQDRAKPV